MMPVSCLYISCKHHTKGTIMLEDNVFDTLSNLINQQSNRVPRRNIPIEVDRYEVEGDETVVWGYNLLEDESAPARKFRLGAYTKNPGSSYERASLKVRSQPGAKGVQPGGLMVMEGAIEKGNEYICNWTQSIAVNSNGGALYTGYATIRHWEGNATRRGVKSVFFLDSANAVIVSDMQGFESVAKALVQTTLDTNVSTPAIIIRVIDGDKTLAFSVEGKRVTDSGNNELGRNETPEEFYTRMMTDPRIAPIQKILNTIDPSNRYKIELIRCGVGFFTKDGCSHCFGTDGKLTLKTKSGKESPASIEQRSFNFNNIPHFAECNIGLRASKHREGVLFFHYVKPLDSYPGFYQMKDVPSNNFTPSSECIVNPFEKKDKEDDEPENDS